MSDNKVIVSNGLTVSVDWIAFTVTTVSNVDSVIEFMGFNPKLFKEMPKGANGYKKLRRYHEFNISLLYDGNEDMGIHVSVAGSGVGALLASFKETLALDTPFGKGYELFDDTVLSRFLDDVLKIGHLTRLDLAIDDFGGKYYSLDEIAEKALNKRIVSKWRTKRNVLEDVIANNEKIGHTIYFGSRQSELLMRIYDKKLERNRGLSDNDVKYVKVEWVRWELELHGKRADSVANLLIKGLLLGEVVIGVLSNYFRIIELDDCNRSRCSSESKWIDFICGIQKQRIFVRSEPKTIEDKINWFVKQVAPTGATLLHAFGGDVEPIYDMFIRNQDRMSQSDRQLVGIA